MGRNSFHARQYGLALTSKLVATALFLASMFITNPAFSEGEWRLFRSEDSKFRFLYPSEWTLGTPRGANVRVTLFPPKGTHSANCNILVKAAPDFAQMKQEELNRIIQAEPLSASDWEEMLGKWSDMRVIKSINVKVDNQPAYFALVELRHKTFDRKVFIKGEHWATFTPGTYWQFGCAGKGATIEEAKRSYDYYLPVFKKMMGSFVFERW